MYRPADLGKRCRKEGTMKKMWEKWTGISLVKRIVVGLVIGVILALVAPGRPESACWAMCLWGP